MTRTMQLHVADGRAHRAAIETIFRSTMAGGSPMPFFLDGIDDYTRFCLEWYFTAAGGHTIAVLDGERVVGYALVATDPAAYERHLKRAFASLVVRVSLRLMSGRLNAPSRRFFRDRARDSWLIWQDRHRIDVADEAHAHMNVAADVRHGTVAAELRAAIDRTVATSGHVSWIGEVNGDFGRRRRALERIVGDVLDERPNITASRMLGHRVVRYTVRRPLTRSREFTAPESEN